jgi:hypothetical protein
MMGEQKSEPQLFNYAVYLALLRAGFDNCVFMWASFRVLTLSPLSVKSMQPYSDPIPPFSPDSA